MFIGHIGAAFAAKRFAPKTSLGTLVFATGFVDLIWPIFLLIGLEHVRIAPGNTRVTPFDFYDYPISHSLLAVLGWSVAVGLGYFAAQRYRTGAWIVGLGVLSHWILDWVVHRPDLPLWPGGSGRYGLGLWNSLPITLIVESAVFLTGLWMFLRETRPQDRVGTWGLVSLIAFLILSWMGAMFGPLPHSANALAWSGLALWLLPPWAAWADRHRVSRNQSVRN
jgi:LexA-binding, inner membrane-associated putative hydrolase